MSSHAPVRVDPGRPFVHPAFDYLLIGGGLSLLVIGWLVFDRSPSLRLWLQTHLWTLVLLSNSAHFAGSTVRLYTKPGSFRDLPFLTMGLPLASLGVLTLAIAWPGGLGRHLQSLYVTWSPYHYAAQAYGLAVMYCYRSGSTWTDADKRWLRLACFVPFLHAFLAVDGAGIEWLAPAAVLRQPAAEAARSGAAAVLRVLSFLMPAAIFLHHQREGQSRLPLISLLIVLSNSVWLVGLRYTTSLTIAVITIFHGLQYLAILTIFHVKERVRAPGGARPWWSHALAFYLACLALGYVLFQVWPYAYVLLGFGFAESVLLVIAAINVHHFIVDAFIWRLRKDSNYAVVSAQPAVS